MNRGVVKTIFLCEEIWGEREQVAEVPPLFRDDLLHLAFTIPDIGGIDGLFEVQDVLHVVNTHTGYVQKVSVRPTNKNTNDYPLR